VIDDAHRLGVQVLVTGDVKYHDARKAESLGILVLDVGHFSSERLVVPWLARQIDQESRRRGWGLLVSTFEGEEDPLRPMELLMR
jgi:putative NIF3 family GTP cyclohydrolase 1 type 2